MAQPLDYTPPKAQTTQTAEEEWRDVLDTLHESGTLRVLNGLAGQAEGVEEVVLNQLLATPGGHNALGSLSVLGRALTALDPDDLAVVSQGLGKGLQAARGSIQEKNPPGLLRLLFRLRDPDVRRALGALLALLKSAGSHLSTNLGKDDVVLRSQP